MIELAVHPDVLLDQELLRRRAGVPEGAAFHVVRRSIDARRGKVRVHLQVELGTRAAAPEPASLAKLSGAPPVAIIGGGPAGMFCAWRLAQRGVRSIVLERGKPVRPRRRDLAALCRRGDLDPQSNYCFGEGGAGTFSDGKLYTRAHKRGPVAEVLHALVGYGASPEILVDARPHIGTNRLPAVVAAMRLHLTDAQVEFKFQTEAIGLQLSAGRVVGLRLADGGLLPCRAAVVAMGHSAPDAVSWLARAGVPLEFKPFALGVRVEHPQAFVDRAQFGALAGHPALGAAAYRFVERVGDVSAFSFCMCPGGFIAPSSTQPGRLVVNGWSPSSRGGTFANSGLVTEVGLAQIGAFGLDSADPRCGAHLQAQLEGSAYEAGGGGFVAPAQRLDDFVAGRDSTDLPRCSYPRGIVPARVDRLLGPLAGPLRAALVQIDAKMPGYVGPGAIAVAIESRTSAPSRLVRHPETTESPMQGLYPCGEGAGYAGGIVSAALDGIRVGDAVARVVR